MGIRLEIKGNTALDEELAALSVRALRGAELGTKEGAAILVDVIHSHMNGPMPPKPGGSDPAKRTGNLYNAVKTRAVAGGIGEGRWTYEVYMDQEAAVYARRIEFGFRGVDSLGRHYNQPPYPYFFKGVDEAISSGVIDAFWFKVFEEALH